jgi:class 3 adenylate cyclase
VNSLRVHFEKDVALVGLEDDLPFASFAHGPLRGCTRNSAAERRQVTVMFSDLVGSTALSARTDPENLREIIAAYQECVAKMVKRFEGFVATYMGDGVLVYFGYPRAHDSAPHRSGHDPRVAGRGESIACTGERERNPAWPRSGP